MGSLEYYALSQQNKRFFLFLITIIKKQLFVLFLWIIVSVVIFSTNFFIYTKHLYQTNKAIIISRTLGRLLFWGKYEDQTTMVMVKELNK